MAEVRLGTSVLYLYPCSCCSPGCYRQFSVSISILSTLQCTGFALNLIFFCTLRTEIVCFTPKVRPVSGTLALVLIPELEGLLSLGGMLPGKTNKQTNNSVTAVLLFSKAASCRKAKNCPRLPAHSALCSQSLFIFPPLAIIHVKHTLQNPG